MFLGNKQYKTNMTMPKYSYVDVVHSNYLIRLIIVTKLATKYVSHLFLYEK